jgi:hypothetical protein
MEYKPSPEAAKDLTENLEDFTEAEELIGCTDCPEGCYVEPDGYCSHGYLSAGRTLGII